MAKQKSVCVFCGSSSGNKAYFQDLASELGRELAQHNFCLVYGGGHVGLMGILADSCIQMGGKVVGVIPKALESLELAHTRLDELRIVDSMHERKALMEKLSDAVIAIPGGFGTLDELNEIITWRQLGFHKMPIIILNSHGYYDYFIKFIERAVEDEFIKKSDLEFIHICNSVSEVIKILIKN